MIDAPLFDGSDTSISGNGAYMKHQNIYLPSENASVAVINPSEGGGCITSGPFKDYQTHLGPLGLVGYAANQTTPNPQADGLGYNPRCLRRDLSVQCAQATNDANITTLITEKKDIASFQDWMQGPFTYGLSDYGVHAGGHYIISGDPGGDFFTSPGDPWFFLHHAQIDRVYWIWQNQDLPNRLRTISGTITMLNTPPSRNATLDDMMDLGVNDGFRGIKIRDAMSTMAGPFCYVYE